MHSFITKSLKVIPGNIYYGKPAKKIKKNLIGLKRNKVTTAYLKKEIFRYKEIITKRK